MNAADATAELDYNHEEAQMTDSDDFEDDTIPGIQQQYVAAVQRQVQSEISKIATSTTTGYCRIWSKMTGGFVKSITGGSLKNTIK